LLVFCMLSASANVLCQDKPIIDTGMLDTWPSISSIEGYVAISPDGRYVSYVIYNQPYGKSTLVVQNLNTYLKSTFISTNPQILFFSSDGNNLCWKQGDTVWLQSTTTAQRKMLGVTNILTYPANARGEWVAMQTKKSDDELKVVNLVNKKAIEFTSITSHKWLPSGRRLLLTTSKSQLKVLDVATGMISTYDNVKDYGISPDESIMVLSTQTDDMNKLEWLNFGTGDCKQIWKGHVQDLPANFVFNNEANKLVFSVQTPDKKKFLWYYATTQDTARLVIQDTPFDNDRELQVSSIIDFSRNNRWMFFKVRRQAADLKSGAITTSVDIWTYRDEILNPSQSLQMPSCCEYTVAAELVTGKIQLLEQDCDEKLEYIISSDYFILRKGGTAENDFRLERWWVHSKPVSYWLVSLLNGKRKLIAQQSRTPKSGIVLMSSPDKDWMCYWDQEKGDYFSLNPQVGTSINLTSRLPFSVANEDDQLVGETPVGIAGWCVDTSILVYDNFDIWKIQLLGRVPPVCITGGFGKRYGIKLRLVYDNEKIYQGNEDLLLTGYDVNTKFNGFFTIQLGKPSIPNQLTMGPYTYYQTAAKEVNLNDAMQPLTGGKGKLRRWVVMRQSATEYPNFFVSKDLKTFTPLTNLQPQKGYNWLSSEPVCWKMYNGQMSHGVLYKPEDFDSTKKYPIIFNYYQKLSHRCYQFPTPGLTLDNVNIPWFVSRGYLVFTPDIEYITGNSPGGMTITEAAYNAVASAAEFLSRRDYIDRNRMAVQGHSFGGHETNGIITQSNLFAAAAEGAGYSDHFSAYLTLAGFPVEKSHKIDHFNQRMGATPWERPDLYKRNSPVLNADKVRTPLLIFHNKRDEAVNFRQAIEMYMALRRLGKPCWLLQYDKSSHVLDNQNDALDYTIRLTQYFDHYLKGTPAPRWMTMSALAPYKSKNNLYDLDPKGNCMKDCKDCKKWNDIYSSRRDHE
jgi:dienelactone hydrolase